MKKSKIIYIIAGPNGAGKTTFALSSLEKELQIDEFVNADEIAKGLSPLKPESVNLQAGKIMLKRVEDLLGSNKSFAIETTLSGRNYLKTLKAAHKKGYRSFLVFLWLPNAKTARKRVLNRVKQGGHNIPEDVIKRRYAQGQKNLVNLYLNEVDIAYIIDNTKPNADINARLIAEKPSKSNFKVYNSAIWNKIETTSRNSLMRDKF